MKNKNKTSQKKYTLAKKNKCISVCFISFLICAIIGFFYCPLIISIIGVLALLLGVASFKKKSVEEKEIIELEKLKKAVSNESEKNE